MGNDYKYIYNATMVVYLDQDVQYRLEVFQTSDLALQNDDRDPSVMSVIMNKDSIKFMVQGAVLLLSSYGVPLTLSKQFQTQ